MQFDSPTANSIDATSDRDFAIEFVQALSFVALHLSRWAEELILYSTTEFGFVKLPEQFSTGSSAMPQKKNPDALELIRGKAGSVFANATELWIAVKGLPLAYNKDMQETQQPVFAAAGQVSSMLRVATGFLAAVSFDAERMQRAASGGFMNALALAAYLVRRGVPFRQAHRRWGKQFASAWRRIANWSNCRRKITRSVASPPMPSCIARCRWMKYWRYTMFQEGPRRCEFGRH